jgi:hypothetical protein
MTTCSISCGTAQHSGSTAAAVSFCSGEERKNVGESGQGGKSHRSTPRKRWLRTTLSSRRTAAARIVARSGVGEGDSQKVASL